MAVKVREPPSVGEPETSIKILGFAGLILVVVDETVDVTGLYPLSPG